MLSQPAAVADIILKAAGSRQGSFEVAPHVQRHPADPERLTLLEEVSVMMFSVNGIELQVEQRGAGSPALVFLHYWGRSSRSWAHVVDRLAPDFRTVTIDQRGWGRSAAPATGYALANLADDGQAVVAALNLQQYILVGHSMEYRSSWKAWCTGAPPVSTWVTVALSASRRSFSTQIAAPPMCQS